MKTLPTLIFIFSLLMAVNNNSSAISPDSGIFNNYLSSSVKKSALKTFEDGDKTKNKQNKLPDNQIGSSETPSITNKETVDFKYLQFNVDKFYDSDETEITELPVNEFEYLKFDINDFVDQDTEQIEELPISENVFEYLKFDVNKFTKSTFTDNNLGELPQAE